MSLTVIVPTFNEAPNIVELVRRVDDAIGDLDAEILFVDDSDDQTPDVIEEAALTSRTPVRLLHRSDPVGGLSGAVVEGLAMSRSEWCLVMDGDLQHPPEMIPILLETGSATGADVVVASRHIGGGSNRGLSGWSRKLVSNGSIALTRAMFPARLRDCTDPMTGFFAVRRQSVDVRRLHPQGFKILLEILARNRLRVVEEPFIFGERHAGESKADLAQGLRFAAQLASLRFGRMSRFAVIGAIGAVANLLIMAGLVALGTNYLVAAAIAAVLTIVGNFFLQEYLVFRDLRHEGKAFWQRFTQSFAFNAADAVIRLPLLWAIVQFTAIPAVIAQAVTLVVAFILRFVFHSRVVYRPRRTAPASPLIAEGALPDRVSIEPSAHLPAVGRHPVRVPLPIPVSAVGRRAEGAASRAE